MAESLDVQVLADGGALARVAAEYVAKHARTAVAARGTFRLALPGGRSPREMLRVLAGDAAHEAFPWARTTVLFADERAVALDDPDSNYRMVQDVLLAPLGARAPRCVPMDAASAELGRAAAEYERELKEPLDLLVLGVGEDGHVASLFPGSPLVADTLRHVAVVRDSPKPPAERMTLTPRAVNEARSLLVLASGESKAAAVARALAPEGDVFQVPARIARRGTWLIDAAAASVHATAR